MCCWNSAYLKIWRVSACKLGPQNGIKISQTASQQSTFFENQVIKVFEEEFVENYFQDVDDQEKVPDLGEALKER